MATTGDLSEQQSRPKAEPSKRLVSLDALRGFDMFWIVGGSNLLKTLILAFGLAETHQVVSRQLSHAPWHGFRAFDLVFPLFLFIAGAVMPFSLGRRLEKGLPRSSIYISIVRRGFLLVLLGCIYNGMLGLDFSNLRYLSVLGFIGLSWMFAALIFVNTKWQGQLAWCIGLLLGYWAALMWVAVPGYGSGNLEMAGNLVGYIDRMFAPGKLYRGHFDPQGLFSLISGTATALMGILTGQLLRRAEQKSERVRTFGYLLGAGIGCVLVGLLWNRYFPINKEMWTSSFTVLTGGLSLLLLSVFYLVIDVFDFKKWAFPFILIGLNPITIYMGAKVISFSHTTNYLFGGLAKHVGGDWGNLLWAFFFVLTELIFLYVLYRKKIFLKV